MKEVLVCLSLLSSALALTLFLKLGDKCRDENEPWTCRYSNSCQALKNETEKSMDICGFEGLQTIVCCPPDPPNQNGSSNNSQSGSYKSVSQDDPSESPSYGKIAKEKCIEYADYVYNYIESPILLPGAKKKKVAECAIVAETLIVGGTPAKLNEFPHMALIGKRNSDGTGTDWFCGGSLISPRFILTAAHCNISQFIESAVVRLGDLDIADDNDRATPIDVKVIDVFDFPDYNHSAAYHDISLLKLEKDIELGPSIRPLCLHTTRSIGRFRATASGWGHTSFGGEGSTILRKVQLDLVSDGVCKSVFEFDRFSLTKGITSDTIFCAGGNEDKDACQGDSGGPLQIALSEPYCMYSQIGVTAFGVPDCGSGIPGGYMRVSHYVPWIESIVWP